MSFSRSAVSFHREDKQSVSNQPTINNNISINASSKVEIEEPDFEPEPTQQVVYPPIEKPAESSAVERENQFLKKVLDLYMNQQVYWSGKFIVLKADELLDLLHILIPNTQLKIFTDDIEINCCGATRDTPYEKVDSITFDDEKHNQLNLKYAKSEIITLLNQYRISTKFVRA